MSFLFSPIGESVSSRIQTESGRKETAKEGKETVLRPILKSIVRTRFFFVLPSSSCSHKRLYYTFTVRAFRPRAFTVRPLMVVDRPLRVLSTTAPLLYFFSLNNIRERPWLISRVVARAERKCSSFIDHPRSWADYLSLLENFSKLRLASICHECVSF